MELSPEQKAARARIALAMWPSILEMHRITPYNTTTARVDFTIEDHGYAVALDAFAAADAFLAASLAATFINTNAPKQDDPEES